MQSQNFKSADSDPLMKMDAHTDPSISSSTQLGDPPISEEQKLAQKKKGRQAVYRQIWMFTLMIVIDIGMPLALYYILKSHVGELIALVISGIPPLLHVIINFIIKRRVEVIGCICIFSFIMSAVLSLISGDARLAMLRDSTTTAVIGLAFVVTLIPIRTHWFKVYPLTFLITQQIMSEMTVEWVDAEGVANSVPVPEFYWTHMHSFRRHAYIWTAIWGVSLLVEFAVKVIMIVGTSLTIDQIVLYGFIVVISIVVIVSVSSTLSSVRLRRECTAFHNEWMKANDYTSQFKKPAGDDNIV